MIIPKIEFANYTDAYTAANETASKKIKLIRDHATNLTKFFVYDKKEMQTRFDTLANITQLCREVDALYQQMVEIEDNR